MSELVGKKLKDYYVLRRLGSGAMAEVYLAQQLSLGRQVALKVLNAELARDPTYVERFHHEARAAAALTHAAIVQIYEVGEAVVAGLPTESRSVRGQETRAQLVHFIAQEFVPGRNLGEVIRGQGRLEPGLALDILRQVAAAIAKADSEGIVHRDIKPENIMLARSGEVKVADFGLARVQSNHPAGAGRGLNLTQIGVTMGTPLYMSPEQIEGRELDSRSDIYSLGVTAYHMLSGVPPFEGDTPLAVAVQHLNQPPEPLSNRRPDIPDAIAGLVHRMLAKQPAERFTSAADLVRELHALSRQGAEQGWATPSDQWSLAEMIAVADDRAAATSRLDGVMRTTALAAQQRSSLQRSSWRWAIAAAMGCVVVGALVAFAMRPRSLLADARTGPERFDNEWEQLYHAKMVDTAEAWQAVETYFGDADAYYRNLAKQGLAQYYLFRTQEYNKALEPLRDLADLGDSDASLRAFGVAGLIVAEAKLGHIEDALRANERLKNDMHLSVTQRTPQLAELLDATLEDLGRPRR